MLGTLAEQDSWLDDLMSCQHELQILEPELLPEKALGECVQYAPCLLCCSALYSLTYLSR